MMDGDKSLIWMYYSNPNFLMIEQLETWKYLRAAAPAADPGYPDCSPPKGNVSWI